MKLYGSLNNRIMEHAKQPEPEVGMGATMTSYTDRYAGTVRTICTVGTSKIIQVQQDKAIRTDDRGMCDSQDYRYEPDTAGQCRNFRRNKNGRWVEIELNPKTHRWINVEGGCGLLLGERDHHHDYNF